MLIIDRSVRSLKFPDGPVAVKAKNHNISLLLTELEILDMSPVQNIKTSVRKDNTFFLVAIGLIL